MRTVMRGDIELQFIKGKFRAGGSGLKGKVPFGLNRTQGKVPFLTRKGSFFCKRKAKKSQKGFPFLRNLSFGFLTKRNLSFTILRNLSFSNLFEKGKVPLFSLDNEERFLCVKGMFPLLGTLMILCSQTQWVYGNRGRDIQSMHHT